MGQVLELVGIFLQVEQGIGPAGVAVPADELPILGDDGGEGPRGMGVMGGVEKEGPFREFPRPGEKGNEVLPVQVLLRPRGQARQLQQGGIEIHVDDPGGAAPPGLDAAGPADEKRHPVPAIVGGGLFPAHPGVVADRPFFRIDDSP